MKKKYNKQYVNAMLSEFISKEDIKKVDKIISKRKNLKSKLKSIFKLFGLKYNARSLAFINKDYKLNVNNNSIYIKKVLTATFIEKDVDNGVYKFDSRHYNQPLNIIKLIEEQGYMDYFKELIGYRLNPYTALVNAQYNSADGEFIIKRPLTKKELKILEIINKDVSKMSEEEVEFINNYNGFLKQLLPTATEVVIGVKLQNDPYSINSVSVNITIK